MMRNRKPISNVRRTGWLGVWSLLAAGTLPAPVYGADNPPQENQIATASWYAPEDLGVIDPRRSAQRFDAAGERLPVVVRVDAEAAEAVIARLNTAFRRTRESFRARLEQEFGTSQVSLSDINSSRFRVVLDDFQAGNALFPVNLVLAQSWAKGYDGEPTVERLGSAVRDLLRTHELADLKSAQSIWVVSLGPSAAASSWAEVAPHAREAEPDRILDRQSAGVELRRNLDAIDRSASGFVTGLLRDTLIPDDYLTGLLLAARYGSRVEVRRYAAGSLIVEKGDVIDRWAALALESINRRGLSAATPGPASAVVARVESPPVAAPESPSTQQQAATAPTATDREAIGSWNWSLVVSGLGFIVAAGLSIGVWWIRRSGIQPPHWLVPAPRQAAEGSMREAILPHLARELKGRLVQVLFAQRMALLENEAAATRRVEELEARLAKLQPAIAEKIRAYERRIRALEVEIEEKDQETRDLLRAKLVLARRELDEEIARNRIELN